MRKIEKDDAPEFWNDYLKKNPKICYERLDDTEEGKKIRMLIRAHMNKHQKYICCYCCKQITMDDSHNEHIKPRDIYPNLSMDYSNLLVSCTSKSCGMAKSRKFEEQKFISPLLDDCESHFRYEEDGHIVGTTAEGKYTIELLNLNTYALVDARKNLFKECCDMANYCGLDYVQSEYMQEKEGKLPRFVDMVTYFWKSGYFKI